MISFVGPVAAGKTTQRRLVREILRVSNHVVSLTYPPFGFLTHHVASLFKAFMLESVPAKDRSNLGAGDPISFIEIRNPRLMRRIIPGLVWIDLLQLLFVAPVLQFISRLGVVILVEDFVPTIYIDHNTYLALYSR